MEDVELVKLGGESAGGLEGCDSFGLGVHLQWEQVEVREVCHVGQLRVFAPVRIAVWRSVRDCCSGIIAAVVSLRRVKYRGRVLSCDVVIVAGRYRWLPVAFMKYGKERRRVGRTPYFKGSFLSYRVAMADVNLTTLNAMSHPPPMTIK